MKKKGRLNVTLAALALLLLPSLASGAEPLLIAVAADDREATFLLSDYAARSRYYLLMNLQPQAYPKLENILNAQPEIEAYSPRLKFGGMFSTFVEATNIRLNRVYPVPLLPTRITKGQKTLARGEIIVPEILSMGMGVKPGDNVVIVTTNKDGSVNGKQFKVAVILESASGPRGRGRIYPYG